MRKTKIVCTLGPATDSEETLRAMLESGLNVARFNFSHGSHAEHKKRLDMVKKLRKEMNLTVAAMLDTKGPEIRLRDFKDGRADLKGGQDLPSPPGRFWETSTFAPLPIGTSPATWQ